MGQQHCSRRSDPIASNAKVKPNDYHPSTSAALILSPDPLAGALVAAAMEVAGVSAAFAGRDESPRAALRRVRPACVLLSFDDPAVHDEAFLGLAMMMGVVLPRDTEKLQGILTTASESNRRPRETTAP
jgi:hypothetical protein